MMIDFITINSGLVPLIEGYALKSYILDLRLSVVCVHIFCFSFSKEKMCYRTKHFVQDLIPPPSIYILQVSHPDSWAYVRVPHLCRVCVYVRIHTHTPTYTLTRVENREDTDNTPIFFSVKNNLSRQATSTFID